MSAPARILVADDDNLMHAILTDLLAEAGYMVLSAWDGEEALAKARAESPDLILLDIMMPKRNGIEVAQELKTSGATRDIPIVIVSTLAGTPAAQISMAEAYLQKPIFPDDLKNTVCRLLVARRDVSDAHGCSPPDANTSPDTALGKLGGGAPGAPSGDVGSPGR